MMDIDKPLRGASILVVEDDPILALDIIRLLLAAGADVKGPALSLERALELANAEHLSCAVLDVTLRDGLVFPAASLLQRRGAGIVFYTGIGDPEAIRRDWPEAEVLVKPASWDLLKRAVLAVCSPA
jgi:DNA-binding response OmpR family regulator